MTAQVTMAGLFPPNGKQKWNRNLNWQPIPVHTVQEANDFILGQSTICNRFDYALNEYRNSTEIQTLLAEKKSLIRFLEEKSGKMLNSLEELNYLYDDLLIEQIKGYRYVLPYVSSPKIVLLYTMYMLLVYQHGQKR